ncbi:MAG TPA: hypothetical protein VGL99_32610 [Chloroflexota bacterium]
MLETIHLVLDRPPDGDPRALVYLAEPVGREKQPPIAISAVFHPEADPTAHRTALAELESELRAHGWQREETRGHALIGVRFHRWRSPSGPAATSDAPRPDLVGKC